MLSFTLASYNVVHKHSKGSAKSCTIKQAVYSVPNLFIQRKEHRCVFAAEWDPRTANTWKRWSICLPSSWVSGTNTLGFESFLHHFLTV